MNNVIIYIFVLFSYTSFLNSQVIVTGQEAVNWFFGENASLKFDLISGKITSDYSPLVTEEGSACISDKLGNLLFYCNGSTVWNRNNQIMQGGTGLLGGYSSTQAAMIIQEPGENNLFYIFNTGDHGTNLYYSVVDMSKDGGLGEVISLNNLLYSNVNEKLTACYSQNGYDIWLITKDKYTHTFLSFLITDTGINPVPVKSFLDLNFDLNDKMCAIGYLKFSPDGKYLAAASYCNWEYELYDFDNSTGQVSNARIMKVDKGLNTYGVAFSPDSRYLYTSCFDYDTYLYQYDISVPNQKEINDSRQTIAEFHDGLGIGAIQQGPDDKLYISHYKTKYLSAINYPNNQGSSCNFVENAVFLMGSRTRLGLPNFAYVNSYSDNKPDPLKHDVYLFTESISASPGDDKPIKIFGKLLVDSIKINNIDLDFLLDFDSEAFNPGNSGLITKNEIIGKKRILNISLKNIKLDTSLTLLAEIPGQVLFADKSRYELRIDNVNWSDSSVTTFTKFGILNINEVCRTNLRKITAISNVMTITPNPVNDIFTINFQSGVDGNYEIKIFDLNGSEISAYNLGYIKTYQKVNMSRPTDELLSGVYLVNLYYNGMLTANNIISIVK